MDNRIWIVIGVDSYDTHEIQGVFSTKEKAEAVSRFLSEDDYDMGGSYYIEDYELDGFEGMNSKGELNARMISLKKELERLEQLFNALES